jgi:hypothetical protein
MSEATDLDTVGGPNPDFNRLDALDGTACGIISRRRVPRHGGSQGSRDEREALDRSRGGDGTKACLIADGLGQAVAFILASGQTHELAHAIPLLKRPLGPRRES